MAMNNFYSSLRAKETNVFKNIKEYQAKSKKEEREPKRVLSLEKAYVSAQEVLALAPVLKEQLVYSWIAFYGFGAVFFSPKRSDGPRDNMKIAVASISSHDELAALQNEIPEPSQSMRDIGFEFLVEYLGQITEAYYRAREPIARDEQVVLKKAPRLSKRDVYFEHGNNGFYCSQLVVGDVGRVLLSHDAQPGYIAVGFSGLSTITYIKPALLDRVTRQTPAEARATGAVIKARTRQLIKEGHLTWRSVISWDLSSPTRAFLSARSDFGDVWLAA